MKKQTKLTKEQFIQMGADPETMIIKLGAFELNLYKGKYLYLESRDCNECGGTSQEVECTYLTAKMLVEILKTQI